MRVACWSLKSKVPEVEIKVYGFIKQNLIIAAGLIAFIALIWHFTIPTRLTGGSNLAFFLSLICLGISVAWIIREIGWSQHKFDTEQHINMCISFHVDLFCIFILFCIFFAFAVNDSCHQGPIGCMPWFCTMMAHQCERCTRFGCGCNRSAVPDESETSNRASNAQESGRQSGHVNKEVETPEQWKKRKMMNAACGGGMLLLGALSFFVPHVSFAISLAICVFLPFVRAYTDKEETVDNSNV